jgi:hypothetical protein
VTFLRVLPDELRTNWILSFEFWFVNCPPATYIHDFDQLKAKVGITDQLIVAVIERAIKTKRKHTLAWVRQVLMDLVPHGITTPEKWTAFEAEQVAEDRRQRESSRPAKAASTSKRQGRSRTIFLDREKKDKDYYDHIYKRFEGMEGESK